MTFETLMQDFLQKVTGAPVVMMKGWEWMCFTTGKICYVSYDMDWSQENDPDFMAACQSVTPTPIQYMEITCTLAHEGGHWLTRAQYSTPEMIAQYEEQIAHCTDEEYYFLPAEIDATRVGMEWIITHPYEVQEFEKNWRALLTK